MHTRRKTIAALATATLFAGVAVLMAQDNASPQPAPTDNWTALNDRVTKLERLANTPPLPPDPTVVAHAATTQPDAAAHLNAPADVKQAFQQMDARVDALERRITLLEQKVRNPVAADDRADEIRQLKQTIEDQRRTANDLTDRVRRLELRNAH